MTENKSPFVKQVEQTLTRGAFYIGKYLGVLETRVNDLEERLKRAYNELSKPTAPR